MKMLLHLFGLFLLVTITSSAAIVLGPVTNFANGHVYFLLSRTNWNASEAEAVALGGHLVAIRNTNENAWILATFLPYIGTHNLSIGLTDREQEGSFTWVSGETNKFRNWAAGEPNNTSGGEDYAEMKQGGKWNDVIGTGNTHYGVAEVLVRQTNDPPTVTISRVPNNSRVDISWVSSSNRLYQVLSTADLNSDSWSSFGTYIYGDGTTIHLQDTTAQPQRYYRVVCVE